MTPEQASIVAQHQAAEKALAAAKEHEQTLRKRVVELLGDRSKDRGTERILLGDGTEAKIVKRLNYKVVNDSGQVKQLEALMPPEVFNDLFKVSYDLVISAYNKLSKPQQNVVDFALIITDGMPAVDYVPTKKVI